MRKDIIAPSSRRTFMRTTAAAGLAAMAGHKVLGAEAAPGPFTLPALPYAHDALTPHIDARTMEIHHGKHHNGYVRKLNAAISGVGDLEGKGLYDLIGDLSAVPAEVRTAVRNNGGGHANHSLFWTVMAPEGKTGEMSEPLTTAVEKAFGDPEAMQEKFSAAAGGRFGSGWAWLIVNGDGELQITSTPNQDNPMMKGMVADDELGAPILGIDVWEHAYYLNYQNRRGDYIGAWWNIVNWAEVSTRYAKATAA